jgi:death-on-curing protein
MVLLTPSPSAIKEIHDTFVQRYGVAGYMCEGMVEGCLERATTFVYDFQPFPKLFLKAAALLYSIIVFHPFVDANKRTAFESTKILLKLNGYELKVTPSEGVNFTKSIAELKTVEVVDIARWLRQHSKRDLADTLESVLLKFIILSYSKTPRKQRTTIPKQTLVLLQATNLYPD